MPVEQLEEEIKRRRRGRKTTKEPKETLNDFVLLFLLDQVNCFHRYCNDQQREGVIPERMAFDQWLELWYSDWFDDLEDA